MSGLLTKITSSLSGDFLYLLVVFVLVFICSVYFSKSRMVSLILAFYPATFLYNQIPYFDKILFLKGDTLIVLNKLAIFLVLFILTSVVINKHTFTYNESSGFLGKIGLSISLLVLFMVFSYSIVNLDVFHDFSGSIDTLFMGLGRVFAWSLLPFIILMFI